MPTYCSNAQWPEHVSTGTTDHVSRDDHGSWEMARAVCWGLRMQGLGGERKIFPVHVWITMPDGSEETVSGDSIYRCKFCGARTLTDPSDQEAPADYCGEHSLENQ